MKQERLKIALGFAFITVIIILVGVCMTPKPVTCAPAPTPSGELRIAVASLGDEVGDPSLDGGAGKFLTQLMFDWLVGTTTDGKVSKDTGLAYDWNIQHTATESIYTFYLRKGIKFHNGDEVTGEDVKFSIEYFKRTAAKSPRAGTIRTYVGQIEVPEPYRVVIHTTKPYPLLAVDLSYIAYQEGTVLPKKYIEEKGETYFNLHPIGSGAYRFLERISGVYVKFEAVDYPHWRIGVPKYKTITATLVPEESSRAAMLQTGKADIIDVSRERATELKKDGFSIFNKPGGAVVYIMMHNLWEKDAFLHDERVREALNLAIDREQIVKYIFQGMATVVGHGRYGSWALGYQPMPLYPYDPERAKALLREAFPGGVTLTINSYTVPGAGVPETPMVVEAVAAMWNAVGVKTKIVPTDYGTQMTQWRSLKMPDTLAIAAWPNRENWISGWRATMHSKGVLSKAKIPELDKLIEAAETELDANKIGARQVDIAKFIREHHLYIPIAEVAVQFAADPRRISSWELTKLTYDWNFPYLVKR